MAYQRQYQDELLRTVEANMAHISLSPTISPTRRSSQIFEAPRSRHTTPLAENRRLNSFSLEQNAYLSPVTSPRYQITRTHSSPCVLDASPKAKNGKFNEPSPNCVLLGNNFENSRSPMLHQRLADNTPLTPVFSNVSQTSQIIRASQNISNDNHMISPRRNTPADMQILQDHLGPIRPNRNQSRPLSNSEHSIDEQLRLHRSNTHLSSSAFNPPNYGTQDNYEQYQPTNNRMGSVGIVSGDAQSILRNSDDTRRSGQQTSEIHDMDDDNASIPSLHLATRIQDSTFDSFGTTISAEDDMDSVMETETNVLGAEEWGCFPDFSMVRSLSPTQFIGQQPAIGAQPVATTHVQRTEEPRRSRAMSPEKEREVFDWLHSLEVDKDNNEYVAEAASSKFLTGKINMEEEFIVLQGSMDSFEDSIQDSQGGAYSSTTVQNSAQPPVVMEHSNNGLQALEDQKMPYMKALSHNTTEKVQATENAASKAAKVAVPGQGNVAEYCGRERRLIVRTRSKKRPILRSSRAM